MIAIFTTTRIIGIVTLDYYGFKANAIVAFWIAYILTRPLVASFGDYLLQPVANSGLGLGTVVTSIIFLSVHQPKESGFIKALMKPVIKDSG